jgi:amino acid transporter
MPGTNESDRPAGSGWFSLLLGMALIVLVLICWLSGANVKVKPEMVLAVWTIASASIMALWGLGRILNKRPALLLKVGQPTITAWVAIFAVTFTIWAIIAAK